jgi:thioredoxin reductase (NADPH)
MTQYDVVIIGAGAAGLTAGLYASRMGMKVLVLEKGVAGGQMFLTEVIENFPGFPEGIKGQQLAEQLKAQALKWGAEIVNGEAKEIQPSGKGSLYTVKTEEKSYSARSVILASGAFPKRLGVPGEESLTGRGVSYCATCDGPLFRNRGVIVVGGGNAAVEEALYLSKFARGVTLIHRREKLRADKVFHERIKNNSKIDFIWNSVVLEILGKKKVSGVKVKNVNTDKKSDVSCEGIFIFVGIKPNTDFLKTLVKMDVQGFIVTGKNLETSLRGIFACGDCRTKDLRQVVTACGEGAEAAWACRSYVERAKGNS